MKFLLGGVIVAAVIGLVILSKPADDDAKPMEVSNATTSVLPETQEVELVATAPDDGVMTFGPPDRESELDPNNGGWQTEILSEETTQQLKRLGGWIAKPPDVDDETIHNLLAEDFICDSLRPSNVLPIHQDGNMTVYRAAPDPTDKAAHRGKSGFLEGLASLRHAFVSSSRINARFKTHGLERNPKTPEHFLTRVTFECEGDSNPGSLHQSAQWECQWEKSDADALPRLRQIRISEFQEVKPKRSMKWFEDCSEAMLGANACYQQQLAPGLNHWLGRLETTLGIDNFGNHGIALGDVDGDGLDDVYVCQPGGLPNRLFVRQADGTVVDRSAEAGVDWLDNTRSALLVDLNNDGFQDLVLAMHSRILIQKGDGSASFEIAVEIPGSQDNYSLSATDYDGDGDLDLYVCVKFADVSVRRDQPSPFVYHDANNGGKNALYRNDGAWRFVDVTAAVGLDVENRRYSLAASWEDYDNDGDSDLYVANDYGRNCLYENRDGTFVNVARDAGVEDSASGMSVSWGDYDRDGRMDLYVGNMFSAAGNRITSQPEFGEGMTEEVQARYQRFVKGNSLFRNGGEGFFDDVSEATGVAMGRWSWSSVFGDLNNDGWEDLFISNGYLTTDDTGDL